MIFFKKVRDSIRDEAGIENGSIPDCMWRSGFIPPTWPIVLNLSVQLSQMLSHTLIHLFLITILWSKQGNYYCPPVRDLSFHSTVYAVLVSPSVFPTNLPSFFPCISFFPSLPVPRLSCFLSFFLFKICFCTKLWVNRVSSFSYISLKTIHL